VVFSFTVSLPDRMTQPEKVEDAAKWRDKRIQTEDGFAGNLIHRPEILVVCFIEILFNIF